MSRATLSAGSNSSMQMMHSLPISGESAGSCDVRKRVGSAAGAPRSRQAAMCASHAASDGSVRRSRSHTGHSRGVSASHDKSAARDANPSRLIQRAGSGGSSRVSTRSPYAVTQTSHTREGCARSVSRISGMEGSMISSASLRTTRLAEQVAQTMRPHRRQWCLRKKSVNRRRHRRHSATSASSSQRPTLLDARREAIAACAELVCAAVVASVALLLLPTLSSSAVACSSSELVSDAAHLSARIIRKRAANKLSARLPASETTASDSSPSESLDAIPRRGVIR